MNKILLKNNFSKKYRNVLKYFGNFKIKINITNRN